MYQFQVQTQMLLFLKFGFRVFVIPAVIRQN